MLFVLGSGAVVTVILVIGMYFLESAGKIKSIIFDRILLGLALVWVCTGLFVPEFTIGLGGMTAFFGVRWLGIALLLFVLGRWLIRRIRLTV